METSDWISLGAAILALIALWVSIVTLWKSHLDKFQPVLSVGFCTLRVYPIKNNDERWYISSFDLPISFTNKGAQLGRIHDIRIRVTFPKLPIDGHYEMFYAKWIVNGNKITKKRFEWIEEAVIEEWMPFVLLPKDTKNKHIVFEVRWDEPVIQEEVKCALELKHDAKSDWEEISTWTFNLSMDVWYQLAEVGTSIGVSPDNENSEKEQTHPEDLHKYTGTKKPIKPSDDSWTTPSYLDFKK